MSNKEQQIKIVLQEAFKNKNNNDDFYNNISGFKIYKKTLLYTATMEDYINVYSQIMIYFIFITRLYYTGDKKGFTISTISNYLPNSNTFLSNVFNL